MARDIGNNLIINYLPQFMNDEEFKSMFISIGPLKSYKIVRDKTTGFSYGFGFVEYELEEDAERAITIFDGHHMLGKRVRVQPANKQDELSSKGHNLYVKNLPSTYLEADLDKLFEPHGKIVTSKVLVDLQTGQSRNVGFVLYDTKAEAEKAIAELNGTTPTGFSQPVILRFAEDSSKKMMTKPLSTVIPQVSPQVPAYKQSYMSPTGQGNGFSTPSPPVGPMRTQNTNRFRFNPMGRDNGTNYQTNTGFQASNTNNNSYYGNTGGYSQGYGTNSGMSTSPVDFPTGPAPYSIFVFNIGDDAEERELWALFSPFGSIQKCTVMMDSEKKVSKGYGFVDMTNAVEAVNAIKNLNGYFYKGRQLNVSFKSKRKE